MRTPDNAPELVVRPSPSPTDRPDEVMRVRSELAQARDELAHVREQGRAFHGNALVDEIRFWHNSAALTRAQAELDALRAQLARQVAQVRPLRAFVRSIERSRFWRLRNRWRALEHALGLTKTGAAKPYAFVGGDEPVPASDPYALWRAKHAVRASDVERMRAASAALALKPLISIVMPAYATPETFLRQAIESVIAQAYPHWELCIADDASPGETVRAVLEEYRALDERIKVVYRERNGHISRSSNSALALASGEFVSFLDHDDVLSPDALYEVALALNRQPDLDYLYSDEDKVDEEGNFSSPFFKPDWCPDSFLGRMYTSHLGTIRRSLVEAVGGFRPEFDGSQDYDLVLRVTDRTDRVHHIPQVLYHWRLHALSAALNTGAKSYAYVAGKHAIEDALRRRGEPGEATPVEGSPGAYVVRFALRAPGRVSVVMPTRDHHEDVDRCLASIFDAPEYPDFEVVLLDNGSRDPHALAAFASWAKREPRVRVVRYDVPFNYSQINNYAAAQSTGEYLLFLNNDTEVVTPDWMTAMAEWAQRPAIGAVGAKLLFEDDTIQHAGVVVGVGGVAGHAHKYLARESVGYYNDLTTVTNYSAVTAACLMVRREVFESVGGFDESIRVAFNDVDFCLRLRRAGYRNVSLPHVELYHYESKSRGLDDTREKQQRSMREQIEMQERWRCAGTEDPCYSPHLTLTAEDYAIRL